MNTSSRTKHMAASHERELRVAQRDALLHMHDELRHQMRTLLQGQVGIISVHEWMKTLDKALTAYIKEVEVELDTFQVTEVAEKTDQVDDQVDTMWIKAVALLHSAYLYI